jgi:hypothetical protein
MYYVAYVFNYVVLDMSIIPQTPQKGHNPNNYGRALMSIYIYIHSANWREDWVLWLGEGHSLAPFHSY